METHLANKFLHAHQQSNVTPPKALTAIIVLCLLSEMQIIYIIYENYYIQWLLLYS